MAWIPEQRDLEAQEPSDTRTKLMELITDRFKVEYRKMVDETQVSLSEYYHLYAYQQQNSLGQVSFTSDCWSHQNLDGHTAVTAH